MHYDFIEMLKTDQIKFMWIDHPIKERNIKHGISQPASKAVLFKCHAKLQFLSQDNTHKPEQE